MAAKNRAGNKNKRPGSKCFHKMMSPKAAARRKAIYLYNIRQQSNLKWKTVTERQNFKEYKAA